MATFPILCHANGTNGSQVFVNENGAGPALTTFGAGPRIDTAHAKFGSGAGDFSVTAGCVQSATSLSFTGQFTIECFVELHGFTGIFFSLGQRETAGGFNLEHFAADIRVNKYNAGSATTNIFTDSSTALGSTGGDGTKHHVALTRDGSDNCQVWVDGVQLGASFSFPGTLSGLFTIGDRLDNAGVYETFGGPGSAGMYIDEIRVCSDTAMYTATFTPPTAEFALSNDVTIALTGVEGAGGAGSVPVAPISYPVLLHFDGADGSTAITNESVTGPTFATVGGAALATATAQFGPSSLDSTVPGGVRAATSITFAGPFTVAGWLTRGGFTGTPFSIGQDHVANGFRISLYVNEVRLDRFEVGDVPTRLLTITGNPLGGPPTGFVHLAVTRDGAGLIKVFVGGTMVGSVTDTTAYSGRLMFGDFINTNGVPETIQSGTNSGMHFDEWIVSDDTTLYTTNFTVPTSPYNLPSGNAVALTGVSGVGSVGTVSPPGASTIPVSLHFNGTAGTGTFLNSNTSGPTFSRFYPVTNFGPLLTANQSKFGGISGDFTGVGYVQSDTPMSFPGDFTIAMWCKRNGVSGRLVSMGVDDATGSLSLTTFNDLLGMKVELTDNVMLLNGSPVGNTGDPFRFLVLQRRAGTMQILAGDNAGAVTLRGTYFFGGTISGKLTIGDKILASGAAEGTQTNFWFDELLVSSDTALFTAPFTAPTTEFTYFPWTGGGGGSQTIRYFPAYGDPDRHFPIGVYEVPAGSSIATVQAELNARGSIRLANAQYNGNLVVGTGQKVYGYPSWGNGSRVTGTITTTPGATDFAVIGVSANSGFVFPASSLVTKRGAFGMTFGNYDGIGSTLENITFNRCNGQPYLNNTGSGYTRNCRWHSLYNASAGFNGKPGGAVLGNDVTRQNWGNVFVGYMPLTGSTCNLWLAGARDAMVVGMVLEEYGPHPDDGGKPTLQFQSMDRAFVLGHSGRSENTEGTYSDAAKALFIGSDMTTGANLVVTRWGPNTQTAVAMHWRDDSGGTVNLAPASTRLTQVEPAVLLNNGTTTPPTGAALTAALDTIVSPIATTKAWARPTLRVIQDPVPNWRALRGAAADERAAVQNIIDLAGVNGTVKINRPYYIGGQVFAKSGQVFDMSAGGVLIAKNDTFAILGTDFQVTTTGTKTLTVLDGVFYGGTAGFLQTEDNMQLVFFFFSGLTFRGQTLCGMGMVDSYAWDNGWIEKCNFTDGNHGIYSTGTDPGGGTGPLISYIDKTTLFRCQITNMSGYAFYTRATRPHNLNGIDECWIENCASGAVRTEGGQNQNYIANSVIKNCGGATAINCMLAQTTVVSCDITGSAANTALISNSCCVEGNDLSPGPGSAIILALRPEEPFATFARPLLFNNTSTASLGPVQSFPMRMGLVFGNNQLPVGDPAAYGKPLGSIEYYTQGSGQVDDDTRVLKVFVDGLPARRRFFDPG
jgi:hypothetical protein